MGGTPADLLKRYNPDRMSSGMSESAFAKVISSYGGKPNSNQEKVDQNVDPREKQIKEIIERERTAEQNALDEELAKLEKEGRRYPKKFATTMSKEKALCLLTREQ